jgi:hypothetical protein
MTIICSKLEQAASQPASACPHNNSPEASHCAALYCNGLSTRVGAFIKVTFHSLSGFLYLYTLFPMPYMDNVQGRGTILCTDITLLVLPGIEVTDAVIVAVKDCESHKLHLKMQFKGTIYNRQ